MGGGQCVRNIRDDTNSGTMAAMSSSRRYQHPRGFLTPDGTWPTGPFRDDAPGYATRTAALTQRLVAALADTGESQRQVALAAGIDPGTLSRILSGQAVPDLGTIDALERALHKALWPPFKRNR